MQEPNKIPQKSKQDKRREKALAILQLDAVDLKILDIMKDFPAATDQHIADIIGMNRSSICLRRNAEKFKSALEEAMGNPIKKLEKNAYKLVENYLNLCFYADSEHGVRERATKTILFSLGILKNEPAGSGTQPNPFRVAIVDENETIEGSRTIAPNTQV